MRRCTARLVGKLANSISRSNTLHKTYAPVGFRLRVDTSLCVPFASTDEVRIVLYLGYNRS
jgi:hypothetical protein